MSLESLVPLLPLCQQLKPGDFPESALVWIESAEIVVQRKAVIGKSIPAPATDEIVSKLPTEFEGYYLLMVDARNKTGKFQYGYARVDPLIGVVYHKTAKEQDEHPATAALRLWMRLNGREVKG